MQNSACLQLLLFSVLWIITAETTVELSWPVTSSSIKLLGFFPQQSDEESSNTLWIRHCRSMFKSAIVLSQRYNISFQGQFLSYEEILTNDDIMVTYNDTSQKVSTSNIVGFVGPAYSSEARYVASYAYRLGILDVSYLATSSDLSTIDTGAFYRVSPSDEKTVLGIKILFQQFEWKSCIVVYQNDEYGYNGLQLLSQKFNEIHIKTSETIKFDKYQRRFHVDIKKTLLHSLSRIVIIWANEISTVTILKKALENNIIDQNIVWILTTSVSLKYFNQSEQQKLIGILTVENDFVSTTINTTLLKEAYDVWKFYEYDTFPGNSDISIYALFTFDATWSLILSLQQLCSVQSSCLEFTNVSDWSNHRFLNAKQYHNIIKTIRFLGVSGKVEFSDGTPGGVRDAYYVIKNIQPSCTTKNNIDYIPVLQWDVNSTKWMQYENKSTDIIWPNRLKDIPTDHKLIQGQELRIAIIESPPSIILKNSAAIYRSMTDNYQTIDITQFDGFYKDLILCLQDRMGFIPVIILAKPTIRFDELIDGVANDSFNIVMSSIDINTKRNRIVDFSIAIMPASYRILIRKPKSIQSDYLPLLKTILWIIWLPLMIMIPYTNTLIWFADRKNEKYETENSLLEMVTSSFSYIPSGKSHSHAKTNSGRVLTSIRFYLQIMLLAIHTAGLVSLLIMEDPNLIISGIDDIKNGKIPSNRIGILVGSQIEEYYLNFISQGKKDYYPLKTPDEIYTRLIKGDIDVSLWSNISTAYHVNNIHCDLMTVGIEFSHGFYQIPLKRGWLYAEEFNYNILSFMESAELDRISLKWFGPRNCPNTNLWVAEIKTMAVTTTSTLFYLIALISIIFILLEFWPGRNHRINLITSIYRPTSTTPQFVLIDVSLRLTELASAMLKTLCSLTEGSIHINIEDKSTFDFDTLLKKTTVLFVSSEFVATMKSKPEQVETIFILEDDKSKVNHQDRFATGEDLICQLADELYLCYEKEAITYSQSGNLLAAKEREQQINQIHSELKKVHQQFFTHDTTTSTPTSTITRLVWLKSKLQDNVQIEKIEKIKKLFSKVISSCEMFDSPSKCHETLLKYAVDKIFLIIDDTYGDSVVTDFKQLSNTKIVGRYHQQSSVRNEEVIDNYQDLCFGLTHDLITHYNKLGTEYSAKADAKTAKEMFNKAYKLCNIGLKFK